MKKTFFLSLVGLLFLGSLLAIMLMRQKLAAAARQSEIAQACTWSEVKLCFGGVNNGCCPPPKGKPQYSDGY